MSPIRRTFSSKDDLAAALADAVAANLAAGIAARSTAALAVSGGSPPAPFFKALLQGRAAAARFVPLWQGGNAPDPAAIARAGAAISAIGPLDAAILGMGNDGHTASFFPGGDTLEKALTGGEPVIAIRAPGAGEPRVTLTLRNLVAAGALYLHVEGEDKARVLEEALAEGSEQDMPVRAVLRQTTRPVTIFWCP